MRLAIRSGGHSGAGHSTVDGGLVIDLRDMAAIEIDPEARTAWVEVGATAGEVTVATSAHGLATGFAGTGTVGVSGMHLWPSAEDKTRAVVKAFMTAVVASPADSLRTSEA